MRREASHLPCFFDLINLSGKAKGYWHCVIQESSPPGILPLLRCTKDEELTPALEGTSSQVSPLWPMEDAARYCAGHARAALNTTVTAWLAFLCRARRRLCEE